MLELKLNRNAKASQYSYLYVKDNTQALIKGSNQNIASEHNNHNSMVL